MTTQIATVRSAVAGVVIVAVLAACGGGDDGDSESAGSADATAATEAPATTVGPEAECSDGRTRGTEQDRERCEDGEWVAFPTATVSELERNQRVNEFLDAAEFNANCDSIECMGTDATYDRYLNLIGLAGAIPGEDIDPYVDEMISAWDAWNNCFHTAEERSDCGDEEGAVEAAITDLYNALR